MRTVQEIREYINKRMHRLEKLNGTFDNMEGRASELSLLMIFLNSGESDDVCACKVIDDHGDHLHGVTSCGRYITIDITVKPDDNHGDCFCGRKIKREGE